MCNQLLPLPEQFQHLEEYVEKKRDKLTGLKLWLGIHSPYVFLILEKIINQIWNKVNNAYYLGED